MWTEADQRLAKEEHGFFIRDRQITAYPGGKQPRYSHAAVIEYIYTRVKEDNFFERAYMYSMWSNYDSLRSIKNHNWWIDSYDNSIRWWQEGISIGSAPEYVKQAAADGDLLSKKAIIEIARRKLDGNRKNVE